MTYAEEQEAREKKLARRIIGEAVALLNAEGWSCSKPNFDQWAPSFEARQGEDRISISIWRTMHTWRSSEPKGIVVDPVVGGYEPTLKRRYTWNAKKGEFPGAKKIAAYAAEQLGRKARADKRAAERERQEAQSRALREGRNAALLRLGLVKVPDDENEGDVLERLNVAFWRFGYTRYVTPKAEALKICDASDSAIELRVRGTPDEIAAILKLLEAEKISR